MNIEHVALQVAKPAEMAAWWCEHLGMQVARKVRDDCFFIADQDGRTVLEIYCNPAAKLPDYAAMDALELHIAFHSDDVQADLERLTAAGALVEGEPDYTPGATGNVFALVRDPWGIPVQLVHRGEPLL